MEGQDKKENKTERKKSIIDFWHKGKVLVGQFLALILNSEDFEISEQCKIK